VDEADSRRTAWRARRLQLIHVFGGPEVAVRKSQTAIALWMFLTAWGCGYLKSGTWEDDPDNWRRVFGGEKPSHVVILHSRYWRSPHFTVEEEYFFALGADPSTRALFLGKGAMVQIEGDEASAVKDNHFGDVPPWFAPKAADKYEVWVFGGEPRGNSVFLIDRDTGVMFASGYQV
jgi:hypothetical protein